MLYWGGGPLLFYFPGQEPPHKEVLGWDPNWGIFGVFLYVYVLFSLLISRDSATHDFTNNESLGEEFWIPLP